MTHATTAAALAAVLTLAGPAALAAQGQVIRLPDRDRALAGEAPVAFSIGRAEGADHEMFGDVAGAAFDASENLYVLDRQNARVMVYDRTGRFLRQVGRKGQGPGELAMPMSMAVGPDGTVAVYDIGVPGFTYFGPDGAYLRGRRLDAGWRPMFVSGSSFAWHPRGGVLGIFTANREAGGGNFNQTLGTSLVLLPAGDGAETRVFDLPQAVQIEGRSGSPGQQMIRVQGPPTFSPQTSVGVLPDGNVAMAFTTGYTVRIVDLNGTTLRYLQRPTRPRLVAEADRERAREQQRQMVQSGRGVITITRGGGGGGGGPSPQARASAERMAAEMRFADTMPALRGIRVAPSGTIWVERTSPTFYDPGPIDLVTAAGEYRGTITGLALPAAISRGGLAAFVERDDLDVPRVVVRRLPQAWR